MDRLRAALIGAGLGVLAALPVPAPAGAAEVVTAVGTVPGAHDIAVNSHGTVFVTDPQRRRVMTIGTDGRPTLFADQIAGPSGLAVDAQDNIYVGTSAGRVLRFAPDGTRSVAAAGRAAVLAVTVDDEGTVSWADASAVWRVANGKPVRYAQVPHPTALVADHNGNLFVATGTQIVELTPIGTRLTVASSGARALAVDASDTLYAGDGCTVRRFPAGDAPEPAPTPGPCTGSLVAAAPGVLYAADARTGAITRIAPAVPPLVPPAPNAPVVVSEAPPAKGDDPRPVLVIFAAVALAAAVGGSLAHRRRPAR
ncbi:hypothetical protein ACQP00_33730 [Dactylosporangium sp. CS-047395]|uniref:hypothetical protein n=1 Tax=Dactylosporangium sp. CS-047395 TaxID=3239936 RepID=UPI003D8BE40F